MKKICLFILGTMCCMEVMPQQGNAPKSFKLTVLGKAGNSRAYAFFTGSREIKPLSGKGTVNFNDVYPDDTLGFIVNTRCYYIPAKNLDSIAVTIKKNKIFYERHAGKSVKIKDGIPVIYDTEVSPPSSLNMSGIASGYSNLAEYMKGRIAGVDVAVEGGAYKVYIRGQKSFMLDNSALIVLDGVTMDSFDTVNKMVNVNDIKSVEVIKDGAGYGSRGANGVVVITTKRASD